MMEENTTIIIDENGIGNPVRKESGKKKAEWKKSKIKSWMVFLALGIVFMISGTICLLVVFLKPVVEKEALNFPTIPSKILTEQVYSDLTGEILAESGLKNAPTYCVQMPNGLDGARPQAGLTDAGVIFEAIAEAGITRFAAIFQNPTSAVIGPIRSLRIYYLEWDTPFDCTIVHAGGSSDALAALSVGGYRDLTENYNYMYRGTAGTRRWNNLFTTGADLAQFGANFGYTTSEVKGFLRLTPEESERKRVNDLVAEKLEITTVTDVNTSELVAKVSEINLWIGGVSNFNVNYRYNADTNTYFRSYWDGSAHEAYRCPNENLGEVNPESACNLVQMNPAVVIAMIVREGKAADNYHESITTSGTGEVVIFQNGTALHGTWSKPNRGEQIRFIDDDGEEIKLAPGQTFITAVPQYGGVEY